MMITAILRRASSTLSNRVISAAIISAANSTAAGQLHQLSAVTNRPIHSKSEPLLFRASLPSHAGFAVADFPYEEGTRVNSDEGLEIAKLGISDEIVSSLAKKGITKLFPIQRAVLEPAMKGRDMIGRARTGTGKTLAFGIPIIDNIIRYNAKHGRGKNPLALALAPTRELAKQVEREFSDAAPNLDTICVYGGTPISQQMRQLDYGVDIVVGTPGRIIDLLNRGALNLMEVQYVVLDEADQMLQVGFQEDVEKILDKLPPKRQTLMFSATMPTWIKQITHKYLNNPLTVDLVGDSDQKLADGISLHSIVTDQYVKAGIIAPLITEHAKGGKTIVFTQTKRDADRLSYSLSRSIQCEALHGDISQAQRERTLDGFRNGYFNVLVATDVASRGLDVPNVDLVIHYELPNNSEIFVHRTGRTGRAGKKGTAILIYTESQSRSIQSIQRDVGCKFKELPRIAVDSKTIDTFSGMGGGMGGGGGRFGSSGRSGGFGNSGSGRSGGFGNSGYGRSGGSGGYGNSGSGRSGGYGNSGSGRSSYGFGNSGSGASSNRYGGSGGGFSGSSSGESKRYDGFGSFGSSGSSGSGGRSGGSSSGFKFGQSGGFGGSDRSGDF